MASKEDLGLVLSALKFAAHKHRNQKRKDSEATPYINHPIDVATTLVTAGGVTDPETIAAALLHDTVEDTDTTEAEIASLFGASVAGLVMECTDDKSLPKDERKRLQIKNASHKTPRAKQVKIADKISNVHSMGVTPPFAWSHQRVTDYFAWSEQVVSGLRGANPELEKLFDTELETARKLHAERQEH